MVSRVPSNLARQGWRRPVQTHPRRLAKWSQLQQRQPQVSPCSDRRPPLAPLQASSLRPSLARVRVPLANSHKTSNRKPVVRACSGEATLASSVALGPSHHRMEPVRMYLAAYHPLAQPDRLPACLETREHQALVHPRLEVHLARVPSLEGAASPWAVAVWPRQALEEPSSSSRHPPSQQPLEVPQHLGAAPRLADRRSSVGHPPLAAAQHLAEHQPLASRLRRSRRPPHSSSSSSSSHLDSWRLETWKAPLLEVWQPSSSRVLSSRAWASAHSLHHHPLEEAPLLASEIVPISKILHQLFHSGGTDRNIGSTFLSTSSVSAVQPVL